MCILCRDGSKSHVDSNAASLEAYAAVQTNATSFNSTAYAKSAQEALISTSGWFPKSVTPGTFTTIYYSFQSSTRAGSQGTAVLDASQKALVEDVFHTYENVAGLKFVEGKAPDGSYDITIGKTDDLAAMLGVNASGVWQAGRSVVAADGTKADGRVVFDADIFTRGSSYAEHVILHEIGHSLGLRHPGSYGISSQKDQYLSMAEDTSGFTVMSYNGSTDNQLGLYDIEVMRYLYGASANRTATTALDGSLTNDQLSGGAGNDMLRAFKGDDLIQGGDGHDSIRGGQGNDVIRGDNGDDSVYADLFNDVVRGGQGSDLVHGGQGDDVIFGDSDTDYLFGDAGNDTIHGGQGADLLLGGDGNDDLYGDRANDSLMGGAGADRFYFGAGTGDRSIVLDFNAGEGDKIVIDDFAGGFNGLVAYQENTTLANGGAALLVYYSGNSISLYGLSTGDLKADMVDFV